MPIYEGDNNHVTDVINPSRIFLVNTKKYNNSVSGLIASVIDALKQPRIYKKLLYQIANVDAVSTQAMRSYFSWHPAVWPQYGDSLRRHILMELARRCEIAN